MRQKSQLLFVLGELFTRVYPPEEAYILPPWRPSVTGHERCGQINPALLFQHRKRAILPLRIKKIHDRQPICVYIYIYAFLGPLSYRFAAIPLTFRGFWKLVGFTDN